MNNPLTTAQLAAALGLSSARVRVLAAEYGITPVVDQPRFKLWPASAVRTLTVRNTKAGRPKLVRG